MLFSLGVDTIGSSFNFIAEKDAMIYSIYDSSSSSYPFVL